MSASDKNGREVAPEDFQEYLQALSESQPARNGSRWRAVQSYTELQFRLHGGARCQVCSTHVRHVVPVRVEHRDGTSAQYSCLCLRCLEAEKAVSSVVELHVGETILEFREGQRTERSTK